LDGSPRTLPSGADEAGGTAAYKVLRATGQPPIKGAQAALEERRQTGDQVEALIAFSTERQGLIDWDALERVDDAWSD